MVSKSLADKLTDIARQQLVTSIDYKKPRMEKVALYEHLYMGNVPKKFRILFNIAIPVFSGLVDTLESDFNEPVSLKFMDKDPSDYFRVKKAQAVFDQEKTSISPGGKWPYKLRVDKHNAIMSGRGFLKPFAISDPYSFNLDAPSYNVMHTQPKGGGMLEEHLFVGQEDVKRTKYQLLNGAKKHGTYDMGQVSELISKLGKREYSDEGDSEIAEKLAKFRALGQDPEGNAYLGETQFNLCEWGLTYHGQRYYLLFDPWTSTWVRCEKMKDIYGLNWPWKSWATHEDGDLFWSKAFADDFYPVADGVITLFNQELTNREKRNLGARAYDEEIFTDVRRLDMASYRPDTLVPANTKGGVKKIADGIFEFKTGEIGGTIDIMDWMTNQTAKATGVNDMAAGQLPKGQQKVNVIFAQQQQMAKRIGYRAQSYQECLQEVGMHFLDTTPEYMPNKMAVQVVGPDGYDDWTDVTPEDFNFAKRPHIEIISTNEQEQANKLKTDNRIKALELLKDSPNINTKMRDETILRDIGGWDDAMISLWMDTQNYGDQETIAKAVIAIKELLKGEEPEINYDADTVFLRRIADFERKHRGSLQKQGLSIGMLQYVQAHAQIAAENMARKAGKIIRENRAKGGGNAPGEKDTAAAAAKPAPAVAAAQ